jgi:hypothetical protein
LIALEMIGSAVPSVVASRAAAKVMTDRVLKAAKNRQPGLKLDIDDLSD